MSKCSMTPFLLRMPAEIRLVIYREVLDFDYGSGQPRVITVTSSGLQFCPHAHSLTLVCRQIRDEVLDYMYAEYPLYFRHSFEPVRMELFLNGINKRLLGRIRRIWFELVLFVHEEPGIRKHPLKIYELASRRLRENLPRLAGIDFFVDPFFSIDNCYLTQDGAEVFARFMARLQSVVGSSIQVHYSK